MRIAQLAPSLKACLPSSMEAPGSTSALLRPKLPIYDEVAAIGRHGMLYAGHLSDEGFASGPRDGRARSVAG